jgi:PAS domain S-box-containing protein
MNCWDFMKCGRTPGGDNVDELGICPAYTYGAGQACWLVAGTFCGGQVQGTFAQKVDSCRTCDFYEQFDLQDRFHMRSRFGYMVLMTAILDAVSALVVVLDTDGRIVRFNRSSERTTGYSFNQVRGRYFWDLFLVSDETQAIQKELQALRQGKFPKQHEYQLLTKDEDHRLIRWLNTVLQDDEGTATHVIATGLDITEYQRALEKNRQLASIVEFSEDAIGSATLDGTITSWNHGAEKIYGYSPEEIIGRRASMLIPRDCPDELPQILKRIQEGQTIEHYETERLHKDGRRLVLSLTFSPLRNADDHLIGISTIGRDVTKQRYAELNYRAIFDAANDAIFVHDIETGAIIDANQKMTEMYGYTIEEARALDVEALSAGTPPYTQQDALHKLKKALEGEPQIFEWLAKDKAGRLFWIEVSIKRSRIGGIERVLAVVREISERKKAEDELRRSRAELRTLAGQLIAAKEEETKRLARELHDAFGQKLAVLNLQVSELESLIASRTDPVLERLRPLREGIGSLAQQIHQLSRQLHPAVLRELGLGIAVESECDSYSRQEGIRVSFSSENVPGQISDDISLCLYRVLQESLQNIRKHAQARKVDVRLAGSEKGILLVIEDFGTGFELEEARRKGGLGLVSIEERVRHVGGDFSISSKLGRGTRIEVRCPLEGN